MGGGPVSSYPSPLQEVGVEVSTEATLVTKADAKGVPEPMSTNTR